MEEQKKEVKKGWKVLWCAIGIVLFVLYFVLLGLFEYFRWDLAHKRYLDGFNGTHEGLARAVYSFFVFISIIPIFGLAVTYVCFLKSFFTSRKGVRRLRIVLLVILVLLNPFVSYTSMFMPDWSGGGFIEGYRDWAKFVLDIDEIRGWMTESDKGVTRIGSKDFQGPKCLAENYNRLRYGMLGEDEEGRRILSIMSGGGMQDWGVVIGPVEMEVPESETVKDDKYHGEYRLKLADGAYVYYELQ